MDDSIHQLLQKLLETDDLVEFDAISLELKRALHERIEQIRKEAQALKPKLVPVERRKRQRIDGKKPLETESGKASSRLPNQPD